MIQDAREGVNPHARATVIPRKAVARPTGDLIRSWLERYIKLRAHPMPHLQEDVLFLEPLRRQRMYSMFEAHCQRRTEKGIPTDPGMYV